MSNKTEFVVYEYVVDYTPFVTYFKYYNYIIKRGSEEFVLKV